MNKPLRHLETGAYQPIAQKPLALPRSMSLEEVAGRQVRAMLSDVGYKPITSEDERAAADAFSRLNDRAALAAEDWATDASKDYANVRD